MVKSGGSQLSQLKSALNQAGVSRNHAQTSNSKKRKRSNGVSSLQTVADKDKRAGKLQQIHERLNPFDVKVTKLKSDIRGQKVKGVLGRPGVSKQAGIEQRRKTLLVEYDQRGRAGGVLDRRFGEDDPTMTPEERMLERFTRERQRASKVSFNLEDDDGDDLTHYGQNLSHLADDFDGTGLALDDEEESGQIDGATVEADHFGGFEEGDEEDEDGQPARKKTKPEVMAEVIAKSKEHKHARQLQKEQDDNARHHLDQDFASIRDLLFSTPASFDPSATGSNSVPLGISTRPPPIQKDDTVKEPSTDAPKVGGKHDEYDQFVHELAFERRARPTDRLKTEEEIAAEEKEKLEKAERSRIRRMNGEDDDESGDDDAGGRKGKKRKRKPEADDLEDDFLEEEDTNYGLGAGLGALGAEGGAGGLEVGSSDEDGEDGSDDEGDSGDEDEDGQSVEDLSSSDDLASDGEAEDLVSTSASKPPTQSTSQTTERKKAKELPFTFPCPETHSDFLDILEGVEDSDVPTVTQRIQVLYHPSLAEGNKAKLGVFTTILIDHILYLASPPSPSFNTIASLSPHIFALVKSYPIEAAQAFISKLVLMQKNLSRGLARGPTSLEAKTFPGTSELALLRMIGVIWSTSDLSHPVAGPAMLLMGQYLAQGRVRSISDISSGLFLCTLFLQYQALAKRLVPEVINFLYNTCLHLAPHSITASSIPGSFPTPDFESEHCRSLAIQPKKSLAKLEPQVPNLTAVLTSAGPPEEQTKVDLFGVTLELVGRFAQLYKSLDCFIELFEPAVGILAQVNSKYFSEGLRKRHTDLQETLSKMLKFARQSRKPLTLQAHKPIAIASLIPKFESNYTARKGRDPDPERNADKKLKALYKKEKKSAVKELRKDNRFLAVEQARRQEEKDAAYKAKMVRAVGEMHSERHEQKLLERAKARDKKRAGRK